MNNVHLEEINAKYLSLSKSQQITAPISFKGSVHFAETVNVSAITLNGLLKEFERYAKNWWYYTLSMVFKMENYPIDQK